MFISFYLLHYQLRKEDYPPQCGWASSNLLKAWIEQIVKEDCSVFLWAGTSVFSCLWTPSQIGTYTILSLAFPAS